MKDKSSKVLAGFLLFGCAILLWGILVERDALVVKVILAINGGVVISSLVGVSLLVLLYHAWTYGLRLVTPSGRKYSQDIPNIHPATASLINNAGVFSVKRILSSSLLRLIFLDVLAIEKRNSSVFLRLTGKENDQITEIDKAVLGLVEFVGDKQSAVRYRQELRNPHTLSPEIGDGVLLDIFPVVAKEESAEYKKHIEEIIGAVYADSINHSLENRIVDNIIEFGAIGTLVLLLFSPFYFSQLFLGVENGLSLTSGLVDFGIFVFYFASLYLYSLLLLKVLKGRSFLSIQGVLMWKDLQALKRWLEDYTLLEEKDTLSVKVWQEYMVYAVALGVSPRVYDDFARSIGASALIMENLYFDKIFESSR